MKDYDKHKESSYLKYLDVNNFYRWAMSQKLPVNDFEWVEDIFEFDESFTKSYNEESHEGYFFEFDIKYPGNFHNLHNNYVNKLVANLHNKNEYLMHIRNLKQALNHRLA